MNQDMTSWEVLNFAKKKAEKIINHTLKVGINGDIKEIHTDCTEIVGE
jgi:hypothetical protein